MISTYAQHKHNIHTKYIQRKHNMIATYAQQIPMIMWCRSTTQHILEGKNDKWSPLPFHGMKR